MNKSIKLKFSAILLSSCIFTGALAEEIPGKALLDYFQATCPSQGNWTQMALNDSRQLINTLQTLKDDPDCASAFSSLDQLRTIEEDLGLIKSNYTQDVEIAKLEAQEAEILTQISKVSEASIVLELESSLRSIQIDKAALVAASAQRKPYIDKNLPALYSGIISNTKSAYSNLTSNQKCIMNNPGILNSATALSSSIAATTAMVNPALGIGLASVTDFIGETIQYFKNRGTVANIRKVAQGSYVIQGLKCALESLTNHWCEMTDASEFLKYESSFNRESVRNSELKKISNLFDKDIPVLLNWLKQVKSGAPASNSADAGRRSNTFTREASVRSARAKGEGVVSENRPLFELAGTRNGKYDIVKTIVKSLAGPSGGSRFGSSDAATPLSEIYDTNTASYYLIGIERADIPKQGQFEIQFDKFDPFTQWPGGGAYTPSLQTINSQYEKWLVRAERRVSQELNLILQPDPLQILTTFYERSGNIYKVSPQTALNNIIDFVSTNQESFFFGSVYDELYSTTVSKLENIRNAVVGSLEAPSECQEGAPNLVECDRLRKALEIVFDQAQLGFGTVVLKNRLDTVVRIAIDNYVSHSGDLESSAVARLLAADTYLDVLSQVSGTDDLARISMDLRGAKATTYKNMNLFGKVFGFHINQIFKKDQRNINSDDEMISELFKDERAQMCFLLASLPKWPKKIKKSYCYGMQLKSENPDAPSSVVIDATFLKSKFSKRSCVYRDHLKKQKIYQNWGIKL